jgi:pimeloyl-ACP methyl ester carboxylesterase
MKSAGPLTTETTTSKDGTAIAYEKAGVGPALILIDAAGHYRRFSSFDGLRALLTADFTVYQFDSRGRGQSGDTAPFAPEREVEDLAALINVAGGSAFVYAFSSGGLVALQASRHGLPITRMGLLEPPIAADEDRTAQRTFTAGLAELINAGRCSAAVEYYLVGIGVPADILDGMRGTDSWAAMEAVAPTLVYDCLISEATSYELLAAVRTPTLVIDSEGSDDDLTSMAATVARGMPNASLQRLAGEWHGVSDDVLAQALRRFFAG